MGGGGRRRFRDTWLWNGTTWREVKPNPAPEPRLYFAMAYHAPSKRVVLFGGMSNADATDGSDGTATVQGGAGGGANGTSPPIRRLPTA